jgi:hypothetical protein
VMADDRLHRRLDHRWRGRELAIEAVRTATKAGALRDDVPADVLVDHAGMVHRYLLRRWAAGEIDDHELRARVLHAYDVCLLAVARPRTRTRLLEHATGLVSHVDDVGDEHLDRRGVRRGR